MRGVSHQVALLQSSLQILHEEHSQDAGRDPRPYNLTLQQRSQLEYLQRIQNGEEDQQFGPSGTGLQVGPGGGGQHDGRVGTEAYQQASPYTPLVNHTGKFLTPHQGAQAGFSELRTRDGFGYDAPQGAESQGRTNTGLGPAYRTGVPIRNKRKEVPRSLSPEPVVIESQWTDQTDALSRGYPGPMSPSIEMMSPAQRRLTAIEGELRSRMTPDEILSMEEGVEERLREEEDADETDRAQALSNASGRRVSLLERNPGLAGQRVQGSSASGNRGAGNGRGKYKKGGSVRPSTKRPLQHQ